MCVVSFSVIRAWRYETDQAGHDDVNPEDLKAAIDEATALVWIDGEEPTEEERDLVLSQLELSPIVVDALMDPHPQRTKLIRYGECFHVAVHDCEFLDNDFESREVDLVVGPGWVLTVRHPTEHSSPVPIDEIRRRFELQFGGTGKPEEGFLLWAVFDVLIDRYFETTEMIDDRLDTIEEQEFGSDGQSGVPAGVFALRRDLAEFRRAVAPMREVVDAISRKEVSFVCDDAIVFFRDIFDRTLRALDYIESERDLLTSLLEADLAVISNRMNDVMKKVTSWGAILLGATLIAGIYGMNFRHMPELNWEYGYPIALGGMLAVMVVLYVIFKKKDWL
jgi:magnesium transporter